jgi:hypothetical protein
MPQGILNFDWQWLPRCFVSESQKQFQSIILSRLPGLARSSPRERETSKIISRWYSLVRSRRIPR